MIASGANALPAIVKLPAWLELTSLVNAYAPDMIMGAYIPRWSCCAPAETLGAHSPGGRRSYRLRTVHRYLLDSWGPYISVTSVRSSCAHVRPPCRLPARSHRGLAQPARGLGGAA